MGKKQKMKKAAAKAAETANSNSNIGKNNNNSKKRNNRNKNKNKLTSINEKIQDENMQKLLSLAEKMQSMPSGSAAPKLLKCKAPSSGSGSSGTDSDDNETSKEIDSDDIPDDISDADCTVTDAYATVVDASSHGDGDGDNDNDNDNDDAITLVQPTSSAKQEVVTIPKYSRGEKKARRLLMKLDLERIPNVSRVTMRKAKNVLLCMDRPDVYKCPYTKTLILFGEMRVEDTSNAAAAQAAERYLNDVNVRPAQENGEGLSSDNKLGIDDDEEDAKLDNGQLDEKDIELVIMQSSCSRQKAIKALLKNNADVVNAIMELTIG